MKHKIYDTGQEAWYCSDCFHREDDGPTLIHQDGSEIRIKNGFEHRENRPAVININGTEEWYENGKRIT